MQRCDRCGGAQGAERAVFVARCVGVGDTTRVIPVPVLIRGCCGAVIGDTTYARAAAESMDRGEYVPPTEDPRC